MQIALERGCSIGVVVRELEPVLDLYTNGLGLGPFTIEDVELEAANRRGSASPGRLRIATAELGPCEMELIEVIGGRPPHAEFLDAQGEGMNHFNLDKGTPEEYLRTLGGLYGRGIEPFWGYPFNSFCYVTSEGIGGISFEVMVGSGHAGKKGHHHLGLVVANTARTIDFYTKTLGLGPFRTGEYPMKRAFYRNERIEAGFRASFCDLGRSRMRLYQELDGPTPLGDALRERGEGMHHLCVPVDDLDGTLRELEKIGLETIWRAPELGMAGVDTRSIGGMLFALSVRDRP
jgi:methylmalonyl-CoA/ethylmalonyl-CoA epimerase